jgi:large subunit ribosomal protein L30
MAVKVKVTLRRSGINRPKGQKATIKGLGLGRPGSSALLPDTDAVRGMIRSISHLVEVEAAE